jgi:ABC-2 type transport system permease protein
VSFAAALLARNIAAGIRSLRLTLVRMVVQPVIYLFVFGYVVGGMLPGSIPYSLVMTPGIVAVATMSAPLVTIGSYVLSGYFFRTMETWLLAPVSLRTVFLAMLASGTASGAVNGLVVAGIAWALLGVVPESLPLLLVMVLAGSLLFSLVILIVLLLPESPDKGQDGLSVLMMPLTFFGCTFYSHDMLAPPFSQLALLLPTTYISEGLRAAYAPGQPHLDTDAILVGLLLAAALLVPLADWAFRRRLGHFSW